MCSERFHWLRSAKQLNIWNETKLNGIHETKPEKMYETKRNFTYDETKRNEISLFFVSRNKRNFAKQFVCFALFRVSRNKKRKRNGNPRGEGRYFSLDWFPAALGKCSSLPVYYILHKETESIAIQTFYNFLLHISLFLNLLVAFCHYCGVATFTFGSAVK
jgi:hypothetical protein